MDENKSTPPTTTTTSKEDLALPSPPTSARKPAPALLLNEEEAVSGPPPSFRLSLSLDNLSSTAATPDPLGNPAFFASAGNNRPKQPLHNPPPSIVQMTDSQLQAALDRWEDEKDEGEERFFSTNLLLCCQNCCFSTTTTTTEPSTLSLQQQEQQPQPPRTSASIILGAVACLCSATLGAGILSLPYAMAEAGMICGMTMLIVSAIATSWSIQLLVQAMQVVYYNNNNSVSQQQHTGEEKTYEDLVEICLGKRWRRVAEACMLIFCGGAAVAYVIAVGDILQQAKLCQSRAIAQTLAWGCAMVPLSMLKTMKSLECASSIGIASITTLVLASLYHYWTHPGEQAPQADFVVASMWWKKSAEEADDDSQSIWVPTQGILSILRACPIILFAFSCQVNVCAIYDEMPGQQQQPQRQQLESLVEETVGVNNNNIPSNTADGEAPPTTATCATKLQRMNQVTWLAVCICALLYSSISIIALMDFGSSKMTPNILTSYNPESVMLVAFIGMTLAVTLAYPMNIFPARVTLLGILRTLRRRRRRRRQQRQERRQQQQSTTPENNNNSNENDLEEPLLRAESTTASSTKEDDEEQEGEDEDEEPTAPRALSEVSESTPISSDDYNGEEEDTPATTTTATSLVEHVLATLFLTGLSLGLALVAPNISVVFGLLGGTSSSVLGFVIPGLLGYQTANEFSPESAKTRRILSMTLVVAGLVVGIVTTAVTIYSTFA